MATTRTHHKRINRKELKQPDEFTAFVTQARDVVMDHLEWVLLGIALLAILVAIGAWIYRSRMNRLNLAGDQFYNAVAQLGNQHSAQAQADFAQLARDEPGREVGRLARFYEGAAAMQRGDLAQARDSFVAYLAEARDPIFRNLALSDLAVVYENLGDYRRAEDAYAEAAAAAGPEQTSDQLGAARMMLRQGNRPGAIEAYRRFLSEHPFSSERGTVVENLAALGVPPTPPAGASVETKLLSSNPPPMAAGAKSAPAAISAKATVPVAAANQPAVPVAVKASTSKPAAQSRTAVLPPAKPPADH